MMTSPKSSNRRECGPAIRQCESFAAKPCRKLKPRNPAAVTSRQCRQARLQRTVHSKHQLTPIKNLQPRLRPRRASGHPDRASPTWNSSKNPRYKEDGAHSQRQGPASAKVSPLTSSITSDTENAGRMALPQHANAMRPRAIIWRRCPASAALKVLLAPPLPPALHLGAGHRRQSPRPLGFHRVVSVAAL